MSDVLIFCGDCNTWAKEKDTIFSEDEGHICYKCLEKRKENSKINKGLYRWL